MSSLKFTLYEILGYLAPGVVVLGALAIIIWAAFLPDDPLPIAAFSLSKEAIVFGIFVAYAFGHLIQGLCNLHPSPEKSAKKKNQHVTLLAGARLGLTSRCGFPVNDYEIADVAALAQTALLNTGKTDDFDVFLYREGFYRGSSAAYLLLAFAFLFRAFHGSAKLKFDRVVYPLTHSPLFFAAALSLLIAVVFYRRYIRFGAYRLRHLLSFVCLPENASSKTKDGGSERETPDGTEKFEAAEISNNETEE